MAARMRVKVSTSTGICVVSPTARWAYVERHDGTVALHVADSSPAMYAACGLRPCTLRAGVRAEDVTNALQQAQRAGAPEVAAYEALHRLGLRTVTDWGAVVRNGCTALVYAWALGALLVEGARVMAR